jgi:hypothetical protein
VDRRSSGGEAQEGDKKKHTKIVGGWLGQCDATQKKNGEENLLFDRLSTQDCM